eukprot:5817804-Alexandrium_andersonii.AAC.1
MAVGVRASAGRAGFSSSVGKTQSYECSSGESVVTGWSEVIGVREDVSDQVGLASVPPECLHIDGWA